MCVDAANLERNLYLTSQILDLGLPTVIVLTMTDVAAKNGHVVDIPALEKTLGVPVRPVRVSKNAGLDALRDAIAALPQTPPPPRRDWTLPTEAEVEVAELSEMLQERARHAGRAERDRSGRPADGGGPAPRGAGPLVARRSCSTSRRTRRSSGRAGH